MIVYNVKHRFFAMKNDAEAYRKAQGLAPDATEKLTIDNREELADFLDGLFRWAKGDVDPGEVVPDPAPRVAAYVPDPANAPDWVPEFIKEDWARRARYAKGG